MIVPFAGNGGSQQVVVIVDGLDHIDEERQELQVRRWVLSWVQQVLAVARGQRPVVVFPVSVQSGKRFLVKQHPEMMFDGHVFH